MGTPVAISSLMEDRSFRSTPFWTYSDFTNTEFEKKAFPYCSRAASHLEGATFTHLTKPVLIQLLKADSRFSCSNEEVKSRALDTTFEWAKLSVFGQRLRVFYKCLSRIEVDKRSCQELFGNILKDLKKRDLVLHVREFKKNTERQYLEGEQVRKNKGKPVDFEFPSRKVVQKDAELEETVNNLRIEVSIWQEVVSKYDRNNQDEQAVCNKLSAQLFECKEKLYASEQILVESLREREESFEKEWNWCEEEDKTLNEMLRVLHLMVQTEETMSKGTFTFPNANTVDEHKVTRNMRTTPFWSYSENTNQAFEQELDSYTFESMLPETIRKLASKRKVPKAQILELWKSHPILEADPKQIEQASNPKINWSSLYNLSIGTSVQQIRVFILSGISRLQEETSEDLQQIYACWVSDFQQREAVWHIRNQKAELERKNRVHPPYPPQFLKELEWCEEEGEMLKGTSSRLMEIFQFATQEESESSSLQTGPSENPPNSVSSADVSSDFIFIDSVEKEDEWDEYGTDHLRLGLLQVYD